MSAFRTHLYHAVEDYTECVERAEARTLISTRPKELAVKILCLILHIPFSQCFKIPCRKIRSLLISHADSGGAL